MWLELKENNFMRKTSNIDMTFFTFKVWLNSKLQCIQGGVNVSGGVWYLAVGYPLGGRVSWGGRVYPPRKDMGPKIFYTPPKEYWTRDTLMSYPFPERTWDQGPGRDLALEIPYPLPYEQTHASENINFLQLRWRAVTYDKYVPQLASKQEVTSHSSGLLCIASLLCVSVWYICSTTI